MFIQQFLKGIPNLRPDDALAVMDDGLYSAWLRDSPDTRPSEWRTRLTEEELDWHLNRFADENPTTPGRAYGATTPFISSSGGVRERVQDELGRTIDVVPYLAEETAFAFATMWGTMAGAVFRGYLFTLGRSSEPLHAFAEDVRDLTNQGQVPVYYPEGEIVAKLFIPSSQISHCYICDGTAEHRGVLGDDVHENPNYVPYERFVNVRYLDGSATPSSAAH